MATIDRRGADLSQTDPAVATDPNPGLAIKAPVRVATTGANITLAGLQTIDGVTLAAGDRILVKDQTDATTNGIYAAQSGNWQRTTDAQNSSQFANGLIVDVTIGTANAGRIFRLAATDPVVLGTSTLAFSVLSIAVTNFTGDSGTGGVQGLVPAPSAGQGAADAVLKASGLFGVVGLTNVRLAKTGAYPVANADKGKTIALGGNAFFTLTFNAASGYDADFAVLALNEDAGRGKVIHSSAGDFADFILWPGQSVLVFNQNNKWQVLGRTRWKLSASVTLFVDAANGNDANDGLAAGTGNALATINTAVNLVVANQWDMQTTAAPQVVIQLADGTYSGGLHYPGILVGGAGNATIVLQGNASTPANVIVSSIALFDNAIIELKNLKIEGAAAGTLSCDSGSMCRLEGGIIFGNGAAGTAQITAQNGARVIADLGYTISGNAATGNGFHVITAVGGTFNAVSQTVTISANLTYTTFALAQSLSYQVYAGMTFTLGGHTVTAQRYNVSTNAVVDTFGAGTTFLPGNAAGAGTNSGTSPFGLYN